MESDTTQFGYVSAAELQHTHSVLEALATACKYVTGDPRPDCQVDIQESSKLTERGRMEQSVGSWNFKSTTRVGRILSQNMHAPQSHTEIPKSRSSTHSTPRGPRHYQICAGRAAAGDQEPMPASSTSTITACLLCLPGCGKSTGHSGRHTQPQKPKKRPRLKQAAAAKGPPQKKRKKKRVLEGADPPPSSTHAPA